MTGSLDDFADIPVVKFEGQELPGQVQLLDIRVDRGLNVVGRATFQFAGSIADVGRGIAKLGVAVTVTSKDRDAVFKGEVTGVEVDRDGQGDHVTTVTALDPLHVLSGHSQVRSRPEVKVSDVLSSLASAAGLESSVTATTVKYEHLLQTGSDLDYLSELAERAGLDWWSHDGKLVAKKVELGAPVATLDARGLYRLSVRASAKRPKKVKVSGWDRAASREVVGEAELATGTLGASSELARAVVAYQPRLPQEHRTSAIPISVPAEAPLVAGTALTRAASGALRAELEGPAVWKVQPGDTVEVTEGGDFDGTYVVSAVEHRVSGGESSTRIIAGSRQPPPTGGGAGPALHGRTPGIVTAKVTNIDDPDNRGRVKVKYLGLDGTQESAWARVLLMSAGPQTGATMLPEVNDEVLVTFEDSDVRQPIVLGSLYTSQTTLPTLQRENGKFTHVTLMERFGHQILMWGKGSEQGVTIKLKNGGEITVDHEGTRLVGVSGKTTTLTQGQAKVELKDNGDITLEGTNVTIKASAKLAFQAQSQAELKGAQVAIQGQATAELKAAKTSVKGDGMLELKGGMVQIN